MILTVIHHIHFIMDALTKLHFILHITAGTSTLIAGPIAIFYNFKDTRKHRLAGKIFFYAMLYVCFSAILGYFRRPDLIFYQFLFGIAILVLAGILRGVRAIRLMKGDHVRPFDWGYAVMLGLLGLWMVGRSILGTQSVATNDDSTVFAILFGVFGIGALSNAVGMMRMFWKAPSLQRIDWYKAHISTMMGAMSASTTAFLVNTASAVLPWYLVWFGPTLLLLPLQFYFLRKIGAVRKG
jgi:uncharacterized membrane protein